MQGQDWGAWQTSGNWAAGGGQVNQAHPSSHETASHTGGGMMNGYPRGQSLSPQDAFQSYRGVGGGFGQTAGSPATPYSSSQMVQGGGMYMNQGGGMPSSTSPYLSGYQTQQQGGGMQQQSQPMPARSTAPATPTVPKSTLPVQAVKSAVDALPQVERICYRFLWEQAGCTRTGNKLQGQDAFDFLIQSGLPQGFLAAVWEAADWQRKQRGWLGWDEFVVAMRLIARAQDRAGLIQKAKVGSLVGSVGVGKGRRTTFFDFIENTLPVDSPLFVPLLSFLPSPSLPLPSLIFAFPTLPCLQFLPDDNIREGTSPLTYQDLKLENIFSPDPKTPHVPQVLPRFRNLHSNLQQFESQFAHFLCSAGHVPLHPAYAGVVPGAQSATAAMHTHTSGPTTQGTSGPSGANKWDLITSAFGDVVQPGGGPSQRISSQQLQHTAAMPQPSMGTAAAWQQQPQVGGAGGGLPSMSPLGGVSAMSPGTFHQPPGAGSAMFASPSPPSASCSPAASLFPTAPQPQAANVSQLPQLAATPSPPPMGGLPASASEDDDFGFGDFVAVPAASAAPTGHSRSSSLQQQPQHQSEKTKARSDSDDPFASIDGGANRGGTQQHQKEQPSPFAQSNQGQTTAAFSVVDAPVPLQQPRTEREISDEWGDAFVAAAPPPPPPATVQAPTSAPSASPNNSLAPLPHAHPKEPAASLPAPAPATDEEDDWGDFTASMPQSQPAPPAPPAPAPPPPSQRLFGAFDDLVAQSGSATASTAVPVLSAGVSHGTQQPPSEAEAESTAVTRAAAEPGGPSLSSHAFSSLNMGTEGAHPTAEWTSHLQQHSQAEAGAGGDQLGQADFGVSLAQMDFEMHSPPASHAGTNLPNPSPQAESDFVLGHQGRFAFAFPPAAGEESVTKPPAEKAAAEQTQAVAHAGGMSGDSPASPFGDDVPVQAQNANSLQGVGGSHIGGASESVADKKDDFFSLGGGGNAAGVQRAAETGRDFFEETGGFGAGGGSGDFGDFMGAGLNDADFGDFRGAMDGVDEGEAPPPPPPPPPRPEKGGESGASSASAGGGVSSGFVFDGLGEEVGEKDLVGGLDVGDEPFEFVSSSGPPVDKGEEGLVGGGDSPFGDFQVGGADSSLNREESPFGDFNSFPAPAPASSSSSAQETGGSPFGDFPTGASTGMQVVQQNSGEWGAFEGGGALAAKEKTPPLSPKASRKKPPPPPPPSDPPPPRREVSPVPSRFSAFEGLVTCLDPSADSKGSGKGGADSSQDKWADLFALGEEDGTGASGSSDAVCRGLTFLRTAMKRYDEDLTFLEKNATGANETEESQRGAVMGLRLWTEAVAAAKARGDGWTAGVIARLGAVGEGLGEVTLECVGALEAAATKSTEGRSPKSPSRSPKSPKGKGKDKTDSSPSSRPSSALSVTPLSSADAAALLASDQFKAFLTGLRGLHRVLWRLFTASAPFLQPAQSSTVGGGEEKHLADAAVQTEESLLKAGGAWVRLVKTLRALLGDAPAVSTLPSLPSRQQTVRLPPLSHWVLVVGGGKGKDSHPFFFEAELHDARNGMTFSLKEAAALLVKRRVPVQDGGSLKSLMPLGPPAEKCAFCLLPAVPSLFSDSADLMARSCNWRGIRVHLVCANVLETYCESPEGCATSLQV
uniref:EH domain-containing protein n=1 Tax=Chromera velia CCMP2878 TaxID=1169474 RepID=A0A0G4HER3_9ALVE|eukprot:Cvel_6573.t1-p1 / transcript=Cvel_6573.t1 / gene=Cvel_6573 / organism=Chromera_velia_CCMP2878 / gene_product=hypothetical protein / transcript_product=hypothetical protein / location=Cvel_scaffold324:35214-41182(+) / protein_length=1639 / sequence_SO=supercontig / SO=protein_coding / is_pseudo=false